MVKQLSFALRLSDVCLNRVLLSSEANVYVDGVLRRHEYKKDGYFIFTDIPEGIHRVSVSSFKFQTEVLDINVDYSPNITAQQRLHYIMLNPSERHPEAVRMPSVRGNAPGAEYVYILRERCELKVAEDTAQAGNTQLRLFCSGAKPQLPSVFRINDKKAANSELITLSGYKDNIYQLSEPLKYPHPRSSSVVALIRVRCDEDGGFFFVIPPDFRPDKESGKIHLTIISDDGTSAKSAQEEAMASGVTELGVIKMKKGS